MARAALSLASCRFGLGQFPICFPAFPSIQIFKWPSNEYSFFHHSKPHLLKTSNVLPPYPSNQPIKKMLRPLTNKGPAAPAYLFCWYNTFNDHTINTSTGLFEEYMIPHICIEREREKKKKASRVNRAQNEYDWEYTCPSRTKQHHMQMDMSHCICSCLKSAIPAGPPSHWWDPLAWESGSNHWASGIRIISTNLRSKVHVVRHDSLSTDWTVD